MASLSRWLSSKSRSGRRPISVSNLLKKEKAGTLFKLSQDKALEYRTSAEFLDGDVVKRWHDRMLERRGENEDGSLKHADKVPGGLADDKSPSDFPSGQLAKGIKVELEHTDSKTLAREIAMDHLTENRKYYDYLKEMEDKAETEKEASGTHDLDYSDNEFDTTGLPALRRKKPLELPSRDEVDVNPNPKVENRRDSQGSITMGDLATPGGFDGLGKTAFKKTKISAAMETLGKLSRTWEVPSDDEDQMGAEKNDHHGPFGVTLSHISAQTDEEATKAAAARVDHLTSLVEESFIDELQKIAEANGGILPWVAEAGDFRAFVSDEMQKQALSGGGA